MSLENDLILDRCRLKRRLLVWRVVAVLAVVLALLAIWPPHFWAGPPRHFVARLDVRGIITDNQKLTDAIAALATDPHAAALIVDIDSPGGSVAGGESLHDAIAAVAAVKPVVAVMRGTAASAGYMVAVPAARIFARQSTLTGSIGVLLESGDISGLLGKLGIAADTIVSGPLKGQPSLTQPLSPAGHAMLQGIVMDLYDQFVQMVAQGRHMDPAQVRALADGRPYTGRQALPLGLIDQFGGTREARLWLAQSRHVPADLPLHDVAPPDWKRGALSRVFGMLGVGPISAGILNSVLSQGLTLDVAWALWQPLAQGATP